MLLESALNDLSGAGSCLVMENDNSSAQGSSHENPVEEIPAVESQNRDAHGSNASSSTTDRSLQLIHHDNLDFTPRPCLSEREKQISVDPQSLQNSCTPPGSVPFEWEIEPGVPKIKVRVPVFTGPLQLPPARIVLAKNRAPASMASSAGCSATASPRSISGLMRSMLKPKGSVMMHTSHSHSNKNDNKYYSYDYDATASSDDCTNSSSPVSILYPHFERAQLDSSLRALARQRSLALARAVDSHYNVKELRRAGSCNVQTNAVSAGVRDHDHRVLMKSKSKRRNGNSSRNGSGTENDIFQNDDSDTIVERVDSLSRTGDQEFTCTAGFCSFLPFVKQKPKQKHDVEDTIEVPPVPVLIMRQSSDVHSLEKFECGDSTPSSATSMIFADDEGGISSSKHNLYFERPNELLVESTNEAFSPVATAFVFDGGRRCPPSVLKKNTNMNNNHKSRQTSRTPSRRVRFSVDGDGHLSSSESSSCNVTPRLRRAREEFNSYLAALTLNPT